MQVKIPSFLSKRSASFARDPDSVQAKKEFIQKYKNWLNNEITKELVEWLDFQLQESVEKDEAKTDFMSLFQSKYSAAHSKGSRSTLRKIIKQFK